MKQLKAGEAAPDFLLEDQDGNRLSLDDFRGKKLLLYFFPRAMTPGCTLQAQLVRDALGVLRRDGVTAAGISPDPPVRQKKFDEKHSLGFRLLSDRDHNAARAYGAWGEKVMFGQKKAGIVRSAFLLGEDGIILGAWYRIKPVETVPLVRELLKQL